MGRIFNHVSVSNPVHPSLHIKVDALVDTGASALFLPESLRDKLGDLEELEPMHCTLADGSRKQFKRYGPVKVKLEGFLTIYDEVVFLPKAPGGGDVEPLIGYIILEKCGAAVDMVGHRLLKVDSFDLKGMIN